MNAFPLDSDQLDSLAADFRARSQRAACDGDTRASLTWEAAAGILHTARLQAWDLAAYQRAAARANAKTRAAQHRAFHEI
jgi:hypothetical protein